MLGFRVTPVKKRGLVCGEIIQTWMGLPHGNFDGKPLLLT
jgi:hypothetical protein